MARSKCFISGIAAILFLSASVVSQDAAAIKPSVVTGDVVSISAGELVLKTNAGDIIVEWSEKTAFKRVPPENPKLSAAVDASRSDIGEGDKLVVSGVFSNDRKRLPARTIYLMTSADIARKQAEESRRWATRGMSGRVTSVNQETKQISVEVRNLMGSSTVVITPKENAVFRRYAPDSVKYSEAVIGSITNIQSGDMIRALGDRGADGLSFAAEEIVSGAFQTHAGTVKAVDTEKREITITDLQTEKDVVVSLGPASVLKSFPAEMAQRMASFQPGGQNGMRPAGQPGQGMQPAGERPSGQATAGQGRQGPGGGPMAGGTRGGIDDMFERLPVIAISEIKAGEIIAVSSSKNGDPSRITAIKLLAGVEPFIRAAQASGQMQRGGRGGVSGSFSIPGIDGFDFP